MDAAAALARLARFGSADAIARHLTDLGCTGVREMAGFCPAARYVAGETGQLVSVTVTHVHLEDGKKVELPHMVGAFVHYFDTARYPDLDAEVEQ